MAKSFLVVFLGHVAALMLLLRDSSCEKPCAPKKLCVQTVVLAPPQLVKKEIAKEKAVATAPSKKKAAAPKKTEAKKKAGNSSLQNELLASASESLSKMESWHSSKVATAPKAMAELVSEKGIERVSYDEEVAGFLQMHLVFPGHGSVKVRLVLERDGKLAAMTVLSSESRENEKYLKETLPNFRFPSFSAEIKEKEHTLIVTLCSEV